jgi:hypothetical protein
MGPVPAPSSTMQRAVRKSIPPTTARATQRELGKRAAMAVPWRRNLPKNSNQSGALLSRRGFMLIGLCSGWSGEADASAVGASAAGASGSAAPGD